MDMLVPVVVAGAIGCLLCRLGVALYDANAAGSGSIMTGSDIDRYRSEIIREPDGRVFPEEISVWDAAVAGGRMMASDNWMFPSDMSDI